MPGCPLLRARVDLPLPPPPPALTTGTTTAGAATAGIANVAGTFFAFLTLDFFGGGGPSPEAATSRTTLETAPLLSKRQDVAYA